MAQACRVQQPAVCQYFQEFHRRGPRGNKRPCSGMRDSVARASPLRRRARRGRDPQLWPGTERGLRREESPPRSEEHTSELQSPCNLVCRLLLEKKKKNKYA